MQKQTEQAAKIFLICYQGGKLEMLHASESRNTYVTWKTEVTYG